MARPYPLQRRGCEYLGAPGRPLLGMPSELICITDDPTGIDGGIRHSPALARSVRGMAVTGTG